MTSAVASTRYRFGRFELVPDERQLLQDGTAVHLKAHAFDLLVALVERSGHLVTKDELLARVWPRVVVEENNLQVHVSALRKVLGAEAIATISGRGYRFALPVAQESKPTTPSNLPYFLTSFIGREKEVEELLGLLGSARLVTLTGAGGCGKTRLAIEVARQAGQVYPDGVWLVELAALTDATLVPQMIATVLGIKERGGESQIDVIARRLGSSRVLLVLDNAEHLIDACAQVAEALLQRCERLVVMATSRERLALVGELTYRVPSLSLPAEEAGWTPESVAACESARLLIDRARLHRPDFAATAQNATAIASVCRRLDGIALAIELAAPRMRTLSVEDLNQRLDSRFALLTAGSRTALPRHRTLRALIDWSYDLLTDAEKAMLRAVSVFAGGWTVQAAEQVVGADRTDGLSVQELLDSLADKNLIAVDARSGSPRYGLLETVRAYAHDRLREAEEYRRLHDRHLDYFVALAETANRDKTDTTVAPLMVALTAEQDNLRTALAWCFETRTDDTAARLAGALPWYWYRRGHVKEGYDWLLAASSAEGSASNPAALAAALRGGCLLARVRGDTAAAIRMSDEALAVSTRANDRRSIAASWREMGAAAHFAGDNGASRECFERALAMMRDLDDANGVAGVLCDLGQLMFDTDRNDEAFPLLQESVALGRKVKDWKLNVSLFMLGVSANSKGDLELARAMLDEALTRSRAQGDRAWVTHSLLNLAMTCVDCRDHQRAYSLLTEGIEIQRGTDNANVLVSLLWGFGKLAGAIDGPAANARFWAAGRRLFEEKISNAMTPIVRRSISDLRAVMGDHAFETAWNEGRAWTTDEAIRHALALGRVSPTAAG